MGAWGHEYVRSLAAQIASEFNLRSGADAGESTIPEHTTDEVLALAAAVVPFFMTHNAEVRWGVCSFLERRFAVGEGQPPAVVHANSVVTHKRQLGCRAHTPPSPPCPPSLLAG